MVSASVSYRVYGVKTEFEWSFILHREWPLTSLCCYMYVRAYVRMHIRTYVYMWKSYSKLTFGMAVAVVAM